MLEEEIEKQFFECFGIEKVKKLTIVGNGFYAQPIEEEQYPVITDEKYLELMALYRQQNINELKRSILCSCMRDATYYREPYRTDFINEVKAIFKGE